VRRWAHADNRRSSALIGAGYSDLTQGGYMLAGLIPR
jgi:hypothetical protein